MVVAEARSASGVVLHRTRLVGRSSYAFTGDVMAWGAMAAASGGLSRPGTLGPVAAFGLESLVAGLPTPDSSRVDPGAKAAGSWVRRSAGTASPAAQ